MIEIVFFIAITLFLTFLIFINYRDSVPRENSKSIQVFKNAKEGFEDTTQTIGNTTQTIKNITKTPINLPLTYKEEEYQFNLEINGQILPFVADTGTLYIVYSDKNTIFKNLNPKGIRCYNKDNCGECLEDKLDLKDLKTKTNDYKCDKGLFKCKNSNLCSIDYASQSNYGSNFSKIDIKFNSITSYKLTAFYTKYLLAENHSGLYNPMGLGNSTNTLHICNQLKSKFFRINFMSSGKYYLELYPSIENLYKYTKINTVPYLNPALKKKVYGPYWNLMTQAYLDTKNKSNTMSIVDTGFSNTSLSEQTIANIKGDLRNNGLSKTIIAKLFIEDSKTQDAPLKITCSEYNLLPSIYLTFYDANGKVKVTNKVEKSNYLKYNKNDKTYVTLIQSIKLVGLTDTNIIGNSFLRNLDMIYEIQDNTGENNGAIYFMKNPNPEIHQDIEGGCEERHIESGIIETDDITISIIDDTDSYTLSWIAPTKTKIDKYLIKLYNSINPADGTRYIEYPSPGDKKCKYKLTDIDKSVLYNINVMSIVNGQSFRMSNTVNIYPSESMESQIAKDIIKDTDHIIVEEGGDAYRPILYHSQCAELLADYDSDDELYRNFVLTNYKS